MKPSSWATLRAKAKRAPEAEQYESLEAGVWFPLQIYAPTKPPRALLFFTKPFLCNLWLEHGCYPAHLLCLMKYSIPTREYWRLILDIVERARLPLCFIGDLDPLDLTTFLALRSGDPDLRQPDREAFPITFAGIDDAWIKICERHLLPKMKGYLPVIRMAGLELEHRDLVLRIAPWIPELIGPRCAELLRAGLKLELEGASNPSFYGNRFLSTLRDHLLRRARVTRRRGR